MNNINYKKGFTPLEICSKISSRRPNKTGLSLTGFTLIEIMVVIAIIGLLAVLAMPNLFKARETSFKNICLTNLKQIDAAKQQWAIENGGLEDAEPSSDDLDPYIKRGVTSLYCPQDTQKIFATSYTINNLATNPACQINPDLHKLPESEAEE